MSQSLTAVILIVSLIGNSPANESVDSAKEQRFLQEAEHSAMANEGLVRSQNLLHDWLYFTDPATGLIPRNLYDESDIWNTKDAAADNFPFLYITSFFTDPDLFEGKMLDMLMTEAALTSRMGRIPDDYSFSKQDYLHPGIEMERIFQNPVRSREVYGEIRQLLSRVYWIEEDEKYLDFVIHIGDYLLGDHHPTRDFPRLRLRDHCGEIIAGLSELYATLHHARPEKAREYREPLYEMLDRVLEVGLTRAGKKAGSESIKPMTDFNHTLV